MGAHTHLASDLRGLGLLPLPACMSTLVGPSEGYELVHVSEIRRAWHTHTHIHTHTGACTAKYRHWALAPPALIGCSCSACSDPVQHPTGTLCLAPGHVRLVLESALQEGDQGPWLPWPTQAHWHSFVTQPRRMGMNAASQVACWSACVGPAGQTDSCVWGCFLGRRDCSLWTRAWKARLGPRGWTTWRQQPRSTRQQVCSCARECHALACMFVCARACVHVRVCVSVRACLLACNVHTYVHMCCVSAYVCKCLWVQAPERMHVCAGVHANARAAEAWPQKPGHMQLSAAPCQGLNTHSRVSGRRFGLDMQAHLS